MPWLTDFDGTEPEAFGSYDGVAFDGLTFEDLAAGNLTLLECWLGRTSFERCELDRSSVSESVFEDVRLVATSLTEARWREVTVRDCVLAGADIAASELRRVTFTGGKLEGVSLRGATLRDAVFERCVLTDLDLTGATLDKCAFRGCRITGLDLTDARLAATDLRTSDLDVRRGHLGLAGATIDVTQLMALAPGLAAQVGIDVRAANCS
jgi:uncharacterized protein YjbI with pentapeptide repeats